MSRVKIQVKFIEDIKHNHVFSVYVLKKFLFLKSWELMGHVCVSSETATLSELLEEFHQKFIVPSPLNDNTLEYVKPVREPKVFTGEA